MVYTATLTIIQHGDTYIFQWDSQRRGNAPITVMQTQKLDRTLQNRIERAVHLLNDLLSQRSPEGSDVQEESRTLEEKLVADPLQSLGRLLFQQMIPPPIQQAIHHLPLGSSLTLVTNNSSLPWEIAQSNEGYLACIFAMTRRLLTGGQPPSRTAMVREHWSALLIGNPTADLPHTATEIEAVAELIEALPGATAPRILMQRRATKATVLQELATGQYDLIHYAGHAYVDEKQPAKSGLQLAKGETLTAKEIRQVLNGHPVVFLNGCGSARLDISLMQGNRTTADSDEISHAMEGVAQAFLAGGARGLLGTHWPIHDHTSHHFAIAFYRALLTGATLDTATQQARIAVHERFPTDPLWAAFTLYANAGEQLINQPQRLQRPGTILAIDLREANRQYQATNGEVTSQQNDATYRRLAETVARYNGVIVPTLADQFVAAFAPTTAQNDSARALQAAQNFTQPSSTDALKDHTLAIIGGIGISSGDLYWSNSATNTQSEQLPLVVGTPLTRAVALAYAGEAKTILLDETAQKLILRHIPPGTLQLEAWPTGTLTTDDAITLAGQPMFRLNRATSVAIPFSANLPRPDVDIHLPFVGREQELTLLERIWQQVSGAAAIAMPQRRSPQGQLVGIAGDAGIGKSRLVQGFAAYLHAQQHKAADGVESIQPRWINLRAPSTHRAAPYEIIVQLFQVLLRQAPTLTTEQQVLTLNVSILSTRLKELTRHIESHHDEMVSLLCELLDLPGATCSVTHLDLQTRQRRITHVLGTLLAEQAQQAPMILWIDDLHWADESSLALLEQLAAGVERLPLLLLTTFRTDEAWQPPWWHRRNYQQIHLDALDDEATVTLIRDLLGTKTLSATLTTTLLDQSAGHPLFAQELVTSLRETNALVQVGEDWQFANNFDNAQVPGTIQRLLLSRLDTLPDQAQQILTTAAVIGNPADPQLLQSLCQPLFSAETIDAALTVLEQRNLLYQPWGSTSYQFHHALMRDVAYAAQSVAERQRTHRRIAEALETDQRFSAPRTEQQPHIEMLAHHYYHSVVLPSSTGQPGIAQNQPLAQRAKAIHYLQQAGERAQQKYAVRNAIYHYQRALTLLDASALHDGQFAPSSANGQSLHISDNEIPLSEGIPNHQSTYFAVLNQLGAAHEIVMELPEAIEALRKLYSHYETAKPATAPVKLAEMARRIGRLYERQSDYETALLWAERGLALLSAAQDEMVTKEQQMAAAALHVRVGCIRYSQGNHHAAIAACEQGIDLTTSLPSATLQTVGPVQAEAHNLLGSIADLQGNTAAAGSHYRAGLTIYQTLGNAYEVARVENNLALVCFRTGEWSEAREHFQRGIAFWEEIEDHYNLAFSRLNLGVLAMYQGDWPEAKRGFQTALAIWQEANNQRWSALCYTNLGLLAIERRSWEEAQSNLQESRSLIIQQKIHHFLPEVTYALGEVALGQKNIEDALSLAQEAITLSQSLGMKLEEALSFRLKGKCFLAAEKPNDALIMLRQAYSLLEEQENRYEIGRTLLQLYHAATALDDQQQADVYARSANAIFQTLDLNNLHTISIVSQ